MNKLINCVIKLICQYLGKETDSFRKCSKYLSLIVGHEHFSNRYIKRYLNKKEKHLFRSFVHKYKISLKIKIGDISYLPYFCSYIGDISYLSYICSYNVKEILFSYCSFDTLGLYYEYLLPPTVQSIIYENSYGYDVKRKLFPKTLKNIEFHNTIRGCSYPYGVFDKYCANIPIKNLLPSGLERLHFNDFF